MNDKLVTLAIHTRDKARILESLLKKNGIATVLDVIHGIEGIPQGSFYVKVYEKDLSRSLMIIESNKLFSYKEDYTYLIDDGNKRILVPVDFSDHSIKACRMAFNIAKDTHAKVKILHVYHNVYFPSHIPFADSLKETPEEGLLDSVRKKMLNLCVSIDRNIADGEWPSVNYSYSLREGDVGDEIYNFTREYKPFLLVIGTKGKNNAVGDVVADVVEMVDVPVLAVPESTPVKNLTDIKHFAFLTNLHSRDLSSFDFLAGLLQPNTHIKITLIHINRINAKGDKWAETELLGMKESVMNRYPELNIGYKLIDSDYIPKAIAEYIEQEKITIACINTRRRNMWRRIFSPSISRKVMVRSDALFLILRGK